VALDLTQALSKRISRLERALGEQLLVRGARGVELSDARRRFLPHARQLLAAPPRPPSGSVNYRHRGPAVYAPADGTRGLSGSDLPVFCRAFFLAARARPCQPADHGPASPVPCVHAGQRPAVLPGLLPGKPLVTWATAG